MRRWMAFLLLFFLVGSPPLQAQLRLDAIPFHPADINKGAPVLQQLVAWWQGIPPLSGSIKWYNLIGLDHGTLTNMGASSTSGWSPTARRGGYTQVNFDGTDDYVDLGPNTVFDFSNTTFTVSFWAKTTSTALGYFIVKRLGTACSSGCGGWFVRLDATTGTITARIVSNTNLTAGARTSSSAVNDGAWHHIAVVFTTDTVTLANNDMTIYLDGAQNQGARTDSGGSNQYFVCTCNLTLGTLSDQQAGNWYSGSIDDVRIWSRGLSAANVAAIYVQGPQGDPEIWQLPPWFEVSTGGAVIFLRRPPHLFE